MDNKWQTLLGGALSENTKKTYSSGQKLLINFCEKHSFLHSNQSPCPASELTSLHFIGEVSEGRQASTLKVYLSAVRALHVQLGYPDPFKDRPRIPLVIKGLQRAKGMSNRPLKQPITALCLHSIRLQLNFALFDDVTLWAACCTAFFGFLRAAEFTAPPSGFDANVHLSVTSVTVDKQPVPDTVYLRLARSKTDQFGKGCSIILARSNNVLCPVAALMSYLQLRGPSPGPLFMQQDASPFTRGKLDGRWQKILVAAGWQGHFTLHSFCVGAATTAATLNFPEYLIKALGRWSSDAYEVYLRLPQQQLQVASTCLATAATLGQSVV